MTQELLDFEHFKNHQLVSVDFDTAVIHTKGGKNGNHKYSNVGSRNSDGYIRLWCDKRLRMKHRLIYFLYYGVLPGINQEIDHIDGVRDNNSIKNLRIVTKSVNNTAPRICRAKKHYSKEVIKSVCELLQNSNLSDDNIAKQTGVSRSTVRDIKVRRKRQTIANAYTWAHRGY